MATQTRFPTKLAADKKPENLPSSARDAGDYLTKEMDVESGLGKYEEKVNTGRAAESEKQRKEEHMDKKRVYGPHFRLETAASALEAVGHLKSVIAEEAKELRETIEKADATAEGIPEESKEADTLKDVLKDLNQAEKDLNKAEKALDKIEADVADEAKAETTTKKESSHRFAYSVRRAAEDVIKEVEPIVEDVGDVIDAAQEAIKDAERIIKQEEKGEKEEGTETETEKEIASEEGSVPLSFANRIADALKVLAGKAVATSNYPPGKTQEDKGDYETKEEISRGAYEVKQWKGMADKDVALRNKEHKLPYTDIKSRAPLQGISLKASFVPNKIRAEAAWVLYRDDKPVLKATYGHVAAGNMNEETWAKFSGARPFIVQNGKPMTFGEAMVAKAKTEGILSVLRDIKGTRKTASDVGKDVPAGENMDRTYLKKYYTEAYGDADFAADLVANMNAKVASCVRQTIEALEGLVAEARADKLETVKAHKAVSVARLLASRGKIAFDRPSIEKAATALMRESIAALDAQAERLKREPITNKLALTAAEVPDKGTNDTPGAEEMANAQRGIGDSALDAVQDGPTKVEVDGTLPPGTESIEVDEGIEVNPDDRYQNQRKPLESITSSVKARLRAQAAARRAAGEDTLPSSNVVPQLTKTASETQRAAGQQANNIPDLSAYFAARTEVGRLQAAGIDPGTFHKNFKK